MTTNFGYGAGSRNAGYLGQGFMNPDIGREEGGVGNVPDEDTRVMVRREGMTTRSWFKLIGTGVND